MEIILKKDVENLGFQDDLLEVKDGYGRNFLIPQGFAVLATPSAKKVLAETLRQRAHRDEKLIKDAEKVADTLEKVTIKIISKTADGTKLFGSVNNADISEALEKQGHRIEKKYIKLEGNNIKRVGKHVAHIRLHRELIVDLPFEVVADPTSLPKKKKPEVPVKEDVISQEEPTEEVAAKEETQAKATVEEPQKENAKEKPPVSEE